MFAAKQERHKKLMLADAQRKQVRLLTKKWFHEQPGRHVEATPKFLRDEMSILQASGGKDGGEIIKLRLEWHCLSDEEKTQSYPYWIHKEVCLKWHDLIMSPWDTITDEELCKLSPEELLQIKWVEQEVEWTRYSKWEKIFERKEFLGGIETPCEIRQRDWFASWSPILFVYQEEEIEFDDEELWEQAQIEEMVLEQDLTIIEEHERLMRIEPAKLFISSLVALTGSDIPIDDCPLCLSELSSEECVALPFPCSKPHCFHRICIRECFGKALFKCPICRVDHTSTIDLFK